MANSAHTVLPEPVGAATRVFSPVLYSVLNTCGPRPRSGLFRLRVSGSLALSDSSLALSDSRALRLSSYST